MNNKITVLIISSILVLLFVAFINVRSLPEGIEENYNLDKYRSENIPEDCKLPVYEKDPSQWREHLSHHKETWFCLEYYDDLKN